MSRQLLEAAESWFLESLEYRDDTLTIQIAAGVVSEPHEIEAIGPPAVVGRSISVEASSRRLTVRFYEVAAYQVYSESFSRPDKHEPEVTGTLREHSRSEYLDALRSSTLFPEARPRAYRHFSLCLEYEIVDVIAVGEPECEEHEEAAHEADA